MRRRWFELKDYKPILKKMINITTASEKDIEGIYHLNQKNLKANISLAEQQQEGFVTWAYSTDLLHRMNALAPSIIAKENEQVVGYALTTLVEARVFHPDLDAFLRFAENLSYQGKPLSSFAFYCMGQVCIEKEYRGQGLFNALYQKHREVYNERYELLLTDISTRNKRSLKAHKKVGFSVIHQFEDHNGLWDVVVWDWRCSTEGDN